jgi:hypothetical protein
MNPTIVGTAVLALLIALMIGGVYIVQSRRRVEVAAEDLQQRILERLCADSTVSRCTILPAARIPIWRGPVQIDLYGIVPSTADRELTLTIARDEAGRAGFTVGVNDELTVAEGHRERSDRRGG